MTNQFEQFEIDCSSPPFNAIQKVLNSLPTSNLWIDIFSMRQAHPKEIYGMDLVIVAEMLKKFDEGQA